jgi:hypothetical protein
MPAGIECLALVIAPRRLVVSESCDIVQIIKYKLLKRLLALTRKRQSKRLPCFAHELKVINGLVSPVLFSGFVDYVKCFQQKDGI